MTFGFIPDKLTLLSNTLGQDSLEEKMLTESAFQTPHKYHSLTLFKALIGKLRDEKTRTSVALQVWEMMKPRFAGTVYAGIVDHATRETY
jgi:hypothetical protein